jgi:hypothetical protein
MNLLYYWNHLKKYGLQQIRCVVSAYRGRFLYGYRTIRSIMMPLLEDVLIQLLSMSAATIDRLLKPIKVRYGKGLSGTKPGNLLKKQIPINTNQWDSKQVGFMEADTVAPRSYPKYSRLYAKNNE